MIRLLALAERLSRMATWAGGGVLLLAAIIITIDVTTRKLFQVSLGGSDELAGYALAITTSWGMSLALLRRANIRIDALYARLPKPLTAWLDLLALVLMGVFMSFVTWFATEMWLNSIEMRSTANTPLQTPLMIPQGLWVAGFVLFLLVLLTLLARVVGLLVVADAAGVGRIAGIRTVEEEMHDEVAAEISQNLRERELQHVN
jgi:TRAP-type C4-dicarboxylate transport system permease small subunit